MASSLDVQLARSRFPSLESGYIFADNAGGSQALKAVADATYDYLLHSNVQLGATYPASQRATARVAQGAEAAAVLFNAASADEVAFGSSSTQLLANLARAMTPRTKDGDEIVITGEHEANVGPWKALAASHNPPLPTHTWLPSTQNSTNPYTVTYASALSTLLELLTPRTRILALSGCSNMLGEFVDITGVVKAVRARIRELGGNEVWVVVDLVAYSPHRSMDVQEWDVDFAVFSFYKLYGPHTAALYTRAAALKEVASIAHHFHSPRYDSVPFKLQPGGPGYELTYAASFVLPYLVSLSTPSTPADAGELLRTKSKEDLRAALERTSALFEAHERLLMDPLLGFLRSERAYARGVRIVGMEDSKARAPTISFVVVNSKSGKGMRSRDIVEQVDKMETIGIRWGHFYTFTLVASMQAFTSSPTPAEGERTVEDGFVRISLVHYNTVEEVGRIIKALEEVLFT